MKCFRLIRLVFCFLTVISLYESAVSTVRAAVQGQIIVDPQNPARMVYNGVTVNGKPKPVILCGPGDPEELFYSNTDANISLLTSRGAKTAYVIAYLKDFGGGSPGDPATGTFDSTLSAWDGYITRLENAGVTTVFFFFDDTQGLPVSWQTAVDKIVNKFKHHKLLIWSVAEEYSEALSSANASAVAARIKAADTNGHVIGIHQLSGTSFNFNADTNLKMFLMQYNTTGAAAVNAGVRSAWSQTQGKKILNMSEIAGHGSLDRTAFRQYNWAAIMGGASIVQVLDMGRASDPAANNDPGKYTDCTRLTDFFENTAVNEISPTTALISGATTYLLANPGNNYIAYSQNASSGLGIRGMTAGNYQLNWLDIISGNKTVQTVPVTAGDRTFTKPSGYGSEVAVYIQRTGTTIPTVSLTGTPTSIPTNVQPTATRIPTAGPTVTSPGSTVSLGLTLFLHGIGKGGDNVNPTALGTQNPLRQQRTVTIEMTDANSQTSTKSGTLSFNSIAGNFQGSVPAGALATGSYIVKVGSPQYLTKTVPGIVTLTAGQTKTIPAIALTTGDTTLDNRLNILDYNVILDCYADIGLPKNCDTATNKKQLADITDDGNVNQFDYNLFLRELSVQAGQ